jgi:RNA polymerase sigma-70 factor (ECF subfamily)
VIFICQPILNNESLGRTRRSRRPQSADFGNRTWQAAILFAEGLVDWGCLVQMDNNHDIEALLRDAQQGDHLAFQKLLSRYHTRLIAALAPQIPSDATKAIEPEDVCQEAYAAAARDLDRFESRGVDSFFAWLLTIARHRLLDMLRALRAEKRSGQLAMVEILGHNAGSTICLLEQFAADSHTPSRSVAARELVESVRFALERLPSNQQDAVRMRYVEGLSLKDTAERMNRRIGAVAMLCQRGLLRLSQLLEIDVQAPRGVEE